MDEKKFTITELVEAITGLDPMEKVAVCDILSGQVTNHTVVHIRIAELILKEQSDLTRAIANWNLELFPAHEDDAILLLLEELLEDVLCQKQLGAEKVDHP